MGWEIKASAGEFERAPAGNHIAVMVAAIDLGTQHEEYQGEVSDRRKIYLVWELPGERKKDGTPHLIGTVLTASMHERATLRKWIENRTGRAWPDGAAFDPRSEVGQGCMLNVGEKNGYPYVSGVAALPRGVVAPAPTHAPVALHLTEFQAGVSAPDWLPYIYGSTVPDVIRASNEIGVPLPGKASKPGSAAPVGGSGGPVPF